MRCGYHIIKVANERVAVAILLERASVTIREQLETGKIGELKRRHAGEFRTTAKITLPESGTPEPAP